MTSSLTSSGRKPILKSPPNSGKRVDYGYPEGALIGKEEAKRLADLDKQSNGSSNKDALSPRLQQRTSLSSGIGVAMYSPMPHTHARLSERLHICDGSCKHIAHEIEKEAEDHDGSRRRGSPTLAREEQLRAMLEARVRGRTSTIMSSPAKDESLKNSSDNQEGDANHGDGHIRLVHKLKAAEMALERSERARTELLAKTKGLDLSEDGYISNLIRQNKRLEQDCEIQINLAMEITAEEMEILKSHYEKKFSFLERELSLSRGMVSALKDENNLLRQVSSRSYNSVFNSLPDASTSNVPIENSVAVKDSDITVDNDTDLQEISDELGVNDVLESIAEKSTASNITPANDNPTSRVDTENSTEITKEEEDVPRERIPIPVMSSRPLTAPV